MRILFLVLLMVGAVSGKNLDAEISETKTYTDLEFDHFDKYDGTNMTVTVRLVAADGSVKRITHDVLGSDLVSKLAENTSAKQSDVEEILEWLKPTIEQLVEEDQ